MTGKYGIQLTEFEVTKDKSEENGVIVLAAQAQVRAIDRIILVRPHPDLVAAGTVQYQNVITPTDGSIHPVVTFKAYKKFNLTKLPWLVELFIGA